MHALKIATGISLIALGGLMALVYLVVFVVGDEKVSRFEAFWLFLFLGLLPIGLGLFLHDSGKKTLAKNRERKNELKLVDLGMKHNGMLTPHLVALHLKIPVSEANTLLENLHTSGLLEIDLNHEGVLEYKLRNYAPKKNNQ